MIDAGRIVDARPGAQPPGDDWAREDHRGRLLLPGFVDTHVHSVQLDVIASYGTELLDWLERYTFPAERRHVDAAHALAQAERVRRRAAGARQHGGGGVSRRVHATSVDALFTAAQRRGMRLVAGKVLMDRHAPEDLRDDVAQAEARQRDADRALAWRGPAGLRGDARASPPTSTPQQLAMAGALLKRRRRPLHADPRGREPRRGGVGRRAVPRGAQLPRRVRTAHGLLQRARRARARHLARRRRPRRCSPTAARRSRTARASNLFLGSGLFDWQRDGRRRRRRSALASDVGGGTSLSMLRTMADAYKVQALRGERLSAWKALHAATRGAAQALGAGRTRSAALEPGRVADVCAVGLGGRTRWRCGATRWHATCTSGSLHG